MGDERVAETFALWMGNELNMPTTDARVGAAALAAARAASSADDLVARLSEFGKVSTETAQEMLDEIGQGSRRQPAGMGLKRRRSPEGGAAGERKRAKSGVAPADARLLSFGNEQRGSRGDASRIRPRSAASSAPAPAASMEDVEAEVLEREGDREWYNDDGGVYDPDADPWVVAAEAAPEARMEAGAHLAKQQVGSLTAKQAAYTSALDKWERDRMASSGVKGVRKVRTLLAGDDDESHLRVHMLVTLSVPPFLDGRIKYTKQSSMVSCVKDPTSDMAVIARKGSAALREFRARAERLKAEGQYWKLAGTQLGKLMRVSAAEENAQDDARLSAIQRQLRAQKRAEESALEAAAQSGDTRAASQYGAGKTSTAGERATASESLAATRKSLPIYTVRDKLLQVIRENRVVVIIGETGSGKTLSFRSGLKIGCTQPRRVAAMSVAKRVAEEVGVPLGAEVGYSIRFEDMTSPTTRIKYMTDGMLLRESLRDSALDGYSVLVLDEAHERSLNTDVLFGLLHRVLAQRLDLKVIVTSATMDADKFSAFFGGVPIFSIPGRTYPVDVLFSKTVQEDYVDAAVNQILRIHLSQPVGDILVFMTGQAEVEAVCQLAMEKLDELDTPAPLLMLPIYSQLPADMQSRVFEAAPPGFRKCVVATNIAETSLTVDGIVYVVDCGYCKTKAFNPRIGMDALLVTPISQANANQRSGRAGRTGPGTAYRLYTRSQYELEMLSTGIPEIQRTNLGNVVLLLKSLGVDELMQFNFMDPPPEDTILSSMYQLWVLGALDNVGELTATGRLMVEFPLDPQLSKMLVLSAELGCSAEVVIITAMLSVPNVFARPKSRETEANAAREKFNVAESDHLTLLHVYQQWTANKCSSAWCTKHFVQMKALIRVREVRAQLLDIMKSQRLPVISCGSDWDVVRKTIAGAMFEKAARIKGIDEYVNLLTAMPCHLHPSSALIGLGYSADYVVYHELVLTSKEYMRVVTAVDPHWLAEFGSAFYAVKDGIGSRASRARELASRKADMEEEMRLSRALSRAPSSAVSAPPRSRAASVAIGVVSQRRHSAPTPTGGIAPPPPPSSAPPPPSSAAPLLETGVKGKDKAKKKKKKKKKDKLPSTADLIAAVHMQSAAAAKKRKRGRL
ncbi:uncharacterized protein AMSG_12204 [Thecamonas trahens ATCC 50062]|uniref:RNA helicase n=1 Tax=Thecamonas trahens ATCC 50062 TaxID=461836 RepID=A0A0L0DM33_THETB|nr:hypothetical protein AMSG_12204 [Thecamonas trahens ATCC 50062]KNC53325.1 hypothetical protein AMSG_12204 [Thecamonas trahens ATCC 50062]|eukprot:XP_013754603.1 hypothetical protein AMSG_12204 [Thecamonas trahens ATCC 50062]